MSHSRGKLHKARCCPWCGTRTLVRDYFNPPANSSDGCVSFICLACCTGFSLRDSPRVHFAYRVFQIDRAQRPPEKPRKLALTYCIGDVYPPGSLPQIGVAPIEEVD